MDIRKIALYLAGKFPPYRNKTNFGRFRRIFKQDFPTYMEDSQIEFIQKQSTQIEDFFFMILDDINKDYKEGKEYNDFLDSLIKLEVPHDILGTLEKREYTRDMYRELLHKTYGSQPTTNQKGEFFEKLCFDILQVVGGFINVKKAGDGGDGGIDVTAEYNFPLGKNTSFTLGFFGQAKYKESGNVSEAEINRLTTTISNDTEQKYQGVFYFTNSSYGPKAREALDNISYSTSNRKSFWLDGDEMLKIVSESEELLKKYSI